MGAAQSQAHEVNFVFCGLREEFAMGSMTSVLIFHLLTDRW